MILQIKLFHNMTSVDFDLAQWKLSPGIAVVKTVFLTSILVSLLVQTCFSSSNTSCHSSGIPRFFVLF